MGKRRSASGSDKTNRRDSDAALRWHEEIAQDREQYEREKLPCPACDEKVHPTNWGAHQEQAHDCWGEQDTVEIDLLRLDGGTQSRMALQPGVIDQYREDIVNGDVFPPVEVYYDGETQWLADGFHRVAAFYQCGYREIAADIHQGTQRDAVLHSVGANAKHGLRRTNMDKRRAVERLLADDEWSQWSDREIARRCGVSDRFVNKMRHELSANRSQIERKVERGGTSYTMQTGQIGTNGNGHQSAEPDEPKKEGRELFKYGTHVKTPLGYHGVVSEDKGGRYVKVRVGVQGRIKEFDYSPDSLTAFNPDEETAVQQGRWPGVDNAVITRAGREGTVTAVLSGDKVQVKTQYNEALHKVSTLTKPANGAVPHEPRIDVPVAYPGNPVPSNYKRDQKANRAGNPYEPQGFDACQTPPYALDPLLPFVERDLVVWEPAAGEQHLVHGLYDAGFETVLVSDLLDGPAFNFFHYEPDEAWDCIITNPPYSLKFDWIERCYRLGKPFALLLPVEALGSGRLQALMEANGAEIMLLNRRVDFKMPNAGWEGAGAQFPTFWFCWRMLLPEVMVYGDIPLEVKKAFHAGVTREMA